ncbi:LysR family transcriptional regulator [Altererythrobacter sp. Root672]|uniref:LysR family transcriptional regulator n=1 Tax=Altererythrobacter sp. Root672 TaxID=1736584 RepID=UPI0006F8FB7B|nr:LysR family transcriptional regulator [Altererythrobacter sp. Root672]KRA84066.1 LysR family transcriptional regulator [Altererythrobacter sp. Root672]
MNSEPSWDLYRTVLTVLREGSLSGAARTLGLTQPTVARHVDALEQAIGAKLFVRTQRGLSPTDRALALMPFAELMESTSSALVRAAGSQAGTIAGTVRISASEVVSVEHLPPILMRMRQRHPALVLELVVSNAVDDLLQRRADIAVRMAAPVQQALVTKRLGSLTLGLYAHRDYLERRRTPVTMEELAQHDLIGFDIETPAIRALVNRFPAFERHLFALRVDSDVAQLAAIRAGFGIGVCQVAVAARDANLCRLLPDTFGVDLPVWIAMHEDLRTSERYREVFDSLVAELGSIVGGTP